MSSHRRGRDSCAADARHASHDPVVRGDPFLLSHVTSVGRRRVYCDECDRSVGAGVLADVGDVLIGVVVAQDAPGLAVVGAHVDTLRAQVLGGGQGGVVQVLGSALPSPLPSAANIFHVDGRELHRADSAIVGGVAVEGAAVGVGDDLVAGEVPLSVGP